MRRIAVLLVLAAVAGSRASRANEARPSGARREAPKLVSRQSLGHATRVEACTSPERCSEWVHYEATPPREVIETAYSRSRGHFFVWSKPEGDARTLDIFVTPPGAAGPARRSAHLSPGFGGDLQWLAEERLWHRWGCGTACVGARLYDADGKVRFTENGSWAEVSPDRRRIAILDLGSVVLIDVVTLARHASAPIPGVGYPESVAWTPDGLVVTFSTGEGEPTVLACAPSGGALLACAGPGNVSHPRRLGGRRAGRGESTPGKQE